MSNQKSTKISKVFSFVKEKIPPLGEKKMEMDLYILCLHKFEDDRVILNQDELDFARTAICKCLKGKGYLKEKVDCRYFEEKKYLEDEVNSNIHNKKGYLKNGIERRGVWSIYKLDLDKIQKDIGDPNITVESAELGYYHHRTIVRYHLQTPEGYNVRKARRILKEKSKEIMETCVKDKINELTLRGKMQDNGIIKFLYTYPLIVKKGIEKEEIPFSDYTTTLCFDIIDARFWGLYQRRHVMRVSGPSAILHTSVGFDWFTPTRMGIHKRLLRDIINAIYQYCLYEEKLRDGDGSFVDILDETILVKLWEHTISTMGGRPIDIQVNIVARIGLIALFIALFSVMLSIVFVI